MNKDIDQLQILELERPHGFLLHKGKKRAIAHNSPLSDDPYLIVSDGEAFGVATLKEPVTVKAEAFNADEWQAEHCVRESEYKRWWPDASVLYVHRLKDWTPFDEPKIFENGHVVPEIEPTDSQKKLLSQAVLLPKEIPISLDVVSVTDDKKFIIDEEINAPETLTKALCAVFDTEVTMGISEETIPLYTLALVRNPRLRISKKNINSEIEGKQMPFEIREVNEAEFCVINSVTDAAVMCYSGERAEAHALALLETLAANETPSDETEVIVEDEAAHEDDPERQAKQFEDSEWDGSPARWSDAAAYCGDSLIDVNPEGADKIIANCKLPFRNPGSDEVNINALRAIGGGRGITAIEKPSDTPQDEWDSKVTEAADRVIGWWPEAFDGREAPAGVFNAAGKEPPVEENNEETEGEAAAKGDLITKVKTAWKGLGDLLTMFGGNDIEKGPPLLEGGSGVAVKTVGGELWHFTWSTNAFEDREGEIFSTKALENYVLEAEKRDSRGFFNLWHINERDGNFNSDFAEKQWQGVIGRFLVEAGPYLDNEKGRAAKLFFSEFSDGHPNISPEGWGCSPEYKYLPEERETGIYENIWISRTSTLPRMAAANIWTKTSQKENVMALSEKQKEAANALFGKAVVESLLKEGEKRTASLEDANIAHKENSNSGSGVESETAEAAKIETEVKAVEINAETQFSEGALKAIASQVGESIKVDFESVIEAVTTVADGVKDLESRIEALEQTKRVTEQAEKPRSEYTFGMFRASAADETALADGSKLVESKPKTNEVTPNQKDGNIASAFFPSAK